MSSFKTVNFHGFICLLCSFLRCEFFNMYVTLSILQENLNINEAANFLVKHIMASENDILKSVVPDTISPQQTTSTKMSCSACFKP